MDFKKHFSLSSIVPFVVVALVWCAVSYLRVGNYKDKLWAHRVNSLEKRAEFKDAYPNIEVDVTVREDSLNGIVLDITHDADTTFGLTLDEYMPGIAGNMWVDVKNLSLENNRNVLDKFDSFLNDNKNLSKNQFVIESRNHEALDLLTKNGYYTSYYVDFKNIDDEVISHLEQVSDSGHVKALSFPSAQYSAIRENVKNEDIDFLTWAHRDTQFEFLLNPFNQKLLDDSRLKVILIKTRGKYHR